MRRTAIKTMIGSGLGLYDSGSEKQESVVACKVIDISDLCPNSKKVIVKYAKVVRGVIAQICIDGMTIHWHVNEYNYLELARDDAFRSRAISLGASPVTLAAEIIKHAPTFKKKALEK